MSTGAQAAPTQSTTQVLSPEQRQLLELSMPGFRNFAANPPERYQGQTIAGFDPAQTGAQEGVLNNLVGAQAGVGNDAAAANRFFTSGSIWDPAANPALRGAIDASTRPITDAYRQQVLPGIGDTAIGAGGFGGSRQGTAEGIASGKYLTDVGDTASKLVQNQYQTNVDAQLKAMGLAPTVQAAQAQPYVSQAGVGDVRQNAEQQQLTQKANAFNYDQWLPFNISERIAGIMQGLPGGSTVSTGSVPPSGPGINQVLGGAASGAALGTAIMPGVGTGVGAAGGAVLPFLFR